MSGSFTKTQVAAGAGGQPAPQPGCPESGVCCPGHTYSQSLGHQEDTKKGQEGILHLDNYLPPKGWVTNWEWPISLDWVLIFNHQFKWRLCSVVENQDGYNCTHLRLLNMCISYLLPCDLVAEDYAWSWSHNFCQWGFGAWSSSVLCFGVSAGYSEGVERAMGTEVLCENSLGKESISKLAQVFGRTCFLVGARLRTDCWPGAALLAGASHSFLLCGPPHGQFRAWHLPLEGQQECESKVASNVKSYVMQSQEWQSPLPYSVERTSQVMPTVRGRRLHKGINIRRQAVMRDHVRVSPLLYVNLQTCYVSSVGCM